MAALLAAGVMVVAAAGYAVGGQAGLFALAGLAAVAALLAARLRIPSPLRRPARSGHVGFASEAFPRYSQIELMLTGARTSRRHFDLAARPVLRRLLAALLADRRRVELARSPAAARAVLGDELWQLLDPDTPASVDSSAPGVGVNTLTDIVDRLEGL